MLSPSDHFNFIQSAREIFSQFYGEPSGPLTVMITDQAGNEVRLAVPVSPTVHNPHQHPIFSATEAEVIQAIGTRALQGKTIARRLSRPVNSSLKVILANLVERGVLTRTPEGYTVSHSSHLLETSSNPSQERSAKSSGGE